MERDEKGRKKLNAEWLELKNGLLVIVGRFWKLLSFCGGF